MIQRLLIVGLGSIGKRHARIARNISPDAQIVVLRHRDCPGDPPPGVDHCVTTIEAAMEFGPQAAVIANPASHHLEVAVSLARVGVHLLVEKPISHNSRGVAELIDICDASGLILMTGYNLRHLASLRRFRDYLRAGRIGRVISVRAEVGQFLPSWRPGTDYRQSVSARADLGGGVLLELSHDIDYLLWMFGDVEWVNATLHRGGSLEINVDDIAHLMIGFAPMGAAAPVIAALSMDFVRHDWTRTCTAIGEAGSIRWDGVEGSVEVFDRDGVSWELLFQESNERDATFIAEWREFVRCIETGDRPTVSGHDGLAALRVVEAAWRSSEGGSVVQCGAPGS